MYLGKEYTEEQINIGPPFKWQKSFMCESNSDVHSLSGIALWTNLVVSNNFSGVIRVTCANFSSWKYVNFLLLEKSS